jgi:hypothetical protein
MAPSLPDTTDEALPALAISPDKVCFIALKARQFDATDKSTVEQEIDVIVAGADRPELGHGLLPVGAHVGLCPRLALVEQLVFDPLLFSAADTCRRVP